MKNITIIAIIPLMFLDSIGWFGRCKGSRDASKWELTIPKMYPIESAIDAYHLTTGQYLKTLDDLLVCPVGLEDKWAGPYLKEKQLRDPWGNRYIYEPNKLDPSIYRLISYGKDGKPGGKGENADQEHFTPITLSK